MVYMIWHGLKCSKLWCHAMLWVEVRWAAVSFNNTNWGAATWGQLCAVCRSVMGRNAMKWSALSCNVMEYHWYAVPHSVVWSELQCHEMAGDGLQHWMQCYATVDLHTLIDSSWAWARICVLLHNFSNKGFQTMLGVAVVACNKAYDCCLLDCHQVWNELSCMHKLHAKQVPLT